MIEKKEFKKLLSEVFAGAGFLKKGSSWYLSSEEIVIVVNLQQSDYAIKYYLNIGIYIKSLGVADFPKENHCHIQSRLGNLFPAELSMIEKACSLEYAKQSDVLELVALLGSQFATLCNRVLTLAGLKEVWAEKLFSRALVLKQAKELLNSV